MPQLKHLANLMTTADVLKQLSDNLESYPGNDFAKHVQRAFMVAGFIVADYAARVSREQEAFDALGDALAALADEAGLEAVYLAYSETEQASCNPE